MFHAQHGEAIIMALSRRNKGTKRVGAKCFKSLVASLIMFFGPASKETTGASKQDVTIKYKIRTKTNEELRQAFLTKYIPRILSLGLTIPDVTIHFDEEQQTWIYQQPDWNEFKKIIKNQGPFTSKNQTSSKLLMKKCVGTRSFKCSDQISK